MFVKNIYQFYITETFVHTFIKENQFHLTQAIV